MGVSEAQIKRWSVDPAAFAEEVLWAVRPDTGRLGPLQLEPQQSAWLRAAAARDDRGHFRRRVCVASWPKREGKTMLAGLYGCWRGVTMQRQNIGVLANSERQAQSNVFAELSDFFRNSPMLKGLVPESDFQTRVLRVPGLHNKLECYPANFRTIQGTEFHVLLTDELHAAEDRGRAFTYAAQQTESRDAQVVIASQAGENVEANALWRYYQAWQQDPEGHILFDYRQDPVTPWARRLARLAQRELLPAEYDRLWRNCWGALGQKLFRAEDVEAAARDFEPPRSREAWRALQEALGIAGRPLAYGAGLDRAGVSREGDRTVWTDVVQVETATTDHRPQTADSADDDPSLKSEIRSPGSPLILVADCETLPTGSEAEVLDKARRSRAIYGGGPVVMEYYGCSDLYGKVAEARLEHPTPQAQQAMFNRAYRALRERRMILPARAGTSPTDGTPGLLKAELLNLEYEMGTTLPRFGTQSGHDDHPYSLAWAMIAAAEAAGSPVFVQELGAAERAEERTAAEIRRLQLAGRSEALWGEDGEE